MELKWQQKPQIRIIISRKSVRKEKRGWLRPEPQRPPVQKGQRESNMEEALSSQQREARSKTAVPALAIRWRGPW